MITIKSKYPFTKQQGLKDCAGASLQMIIKYYNGYISLDELNELMQVTKNGTNAYNLIETAKKIGFDAKGIKVSLNELNEDNVVLPLIAHTIIDNKYKHFVVVYKINFKKKYLVLADPQTKIKRMSLKDFEKIYNGYIFTFIPIKPIVRNNEVIIYKIFFDLIKTYRKEVLHLLFISLVYMTLALISSFYVKVIFDNIHIRNNLLLLIFLFFVSLNIVKITANFLRTRLLIFINQKIDIELNLDAYKNVINLPHHYYKNRTTGEMISKLMDLDKVREMINKVIVIFFIDLPLTLISTIFLILINKQLFFISIIFLFLYALIVVVGKKMINEKMENCYQKKSDVVSFMQESINGFETVKGLNIENKIIRKYEIKYIKYLKQIIDLDNFLNNQSYFKEFINVMSELVILFVGSIYVKNNVITIGTLLAFNSIQAFFFTPIRNVIDLDINVIEAKKVLKKVYEMFENRKNNKDIKQIKGMINVNKLMYEYNDKKVLKNVSFKIDSGEKVIILGNSGSGKSTLLKILVGYLEVKRNMIFYEENDINDIGNLRDAITYISQNEVVFTDTIDNNVSIYNNDDKYNILKDCYVDEIIKDDILGYNMVLEENGFNISGGQKQRIILARALMKKFNILIIDEGLNEIDINLERKILKNVFKRFKNKTIIIVSHRKENLDLFDHLIEIDNGKVKKDILRNV